MALYYPRTCVTNYASNSWFSCVVGTELCLAISPRKINSSVMKQALVFPFECFRYRGMGKEGTRVTKCLHTQRYVFKFFLSTFYRTSTIRNQTVPRLYLQDSSDSEIIPIPWADRISPFPNGSKVVLVRDTASRTD